MALERLIAVSRVMTRKRSDDCGIIPAGSSATRGTLGFLALMVEVILGPARQRHQLSGHERLILAGLGY